MSSITSNTLRRLCLLLIIGAGTVASVSAQDVKLQLDDLDKLEARASDSINVTLDGKLLSIAKAFLKDDNPKEAAIKELVGGLQGVYVKVFQFDKDGAYSATDIDTVRAQLRGPGWSRMADVKSRKDGENVEVFMRTTGTQVNGIAVIAADPRRLAVVNIVGSMDLEKLLKLSGKFGIPSLDINIGNKE